jgi:tetratricopeptide (TPR) repeat protein
LPPPTNEAPAAAQRADDEAAIGDNFMEMGKYDQAILSYRTVLARFPNNPELLRKLERARRAQAAEEQVLQQR